MKCDWISVAISPSKTECRRGYVFLFCCCRPWIDSRRCSCLQTTAGNVGSLSFASIYPTANKRLFLAICLGNLSHCFSRESKIALSQSYQRNLTLLLSHQLPHRFFDHNHSFLVFSKSSSHLKMRNLGNHRNNKACAQTPRRSSQRFAKTMALTALDSKRHRARCTAPKKRWKTKRQLSTAVAEVTPHKSTPEATFPPRIIQTVERPKSSSNDKTKKRRKKKGSTDKVQEAPLVKPTVLARLDLRGAFKGNSCEQKNGIRGNHDSRIKTLRSCKVTTYPNEPIIGPTPFPVKLYQMVQSCSIEHPETCHWSEDGTCIELNAKNPALASILRRHFNRKFIILFDSEFFDLIDICIAVR